MTEMKVVAKEMIDLLVDHPEEVALKEITEGRNIRLTISCNKKDTGKIIGKSGKNIESLRILLKAIAAKTLQKSLILGVEEDYVK